MTTRKMPEKLSISTLNHLLALARLDYIDKLDVLVPHELKESTSPNALTYMRA